MKTTMYRVVSRLAAAGFGVILCLCGSALPVAAQAPVVQITVALNESLGPLEINRMALGQGGLSSDPIWAERVPEIRALRPRLIRLFIQEYFNLLPGRYSLFPEGKKPAV